MLAILGEQRKAEEPEAPVMGSDARADGKVEWGGGLPGLQGTSRPTGYRGDASLQPWPEWGTEASEGEAATLGPRGWRCPLQTNRKRVSESPRGIGQRGGQAQTPGLCQVSFLPSTLASHPAGCRADPWARGSSAACSQVRGLALGRHPMLLQGSSKDKEKESRNPQEQHRKVL